MKKNVLERKDETLFLFSAYLLEKFRRTASKSHGQTNSLPFSSFDFLLCSRISDSSALGFITLDLLASIATEKISKGQRVSGLVPSFAFLSSFFVTHFSFPFLSLFGCVVLTFFS